MLSLHITNSYLHAANSLLHTSQAQAMYLKLQHIITIKKNMALLN